MYIFRIISHHWSGFVITLHLLLFWVSIHIIFPIEAALLGSLTSISSVLFLPHAVRVLSTWLLGPKALFALIPAEVIIHAIWGLDFSYPQSLLIPLFSASSALIGFESLRLLGYNMYSYANLLPNWRGVIIAGIIASFFNSITGALLKGELINKGQLLEVIIRYLIGDIAGLIICMLMLILIFRMIDRITSSRG